MKKLVIIRGIPGSGKSTFANKILTVAEKSGETTYHCEADDYFMVDGEYKFDRAKLGAAHSTCFNNIIGAMKKGIDCVVVSNTFTTIREIKPYVEAAESYDYQVVVYRMMGEKMGDETNDVLGRFASFTNVHSVPTEALRNMVNRFADYDGEIIIHNKRN